MDRHSHRRDSRPCPYVSCPECSGLSDQRVSQERSLDWGIAPLIPLGLGGLILTVLLFRGRLVPRWIAVVGIIGYGLLLPSAIIGLFGIFETVPPAPRALLALPVAVWEIIIMPICLFARGFNTATMSTKPGTS